MLGRIVSNRNQTQADLNQEQCCMSTEKLIYPFPSRPHRSLGLLLSDQLGEIQVADTCMQIHVVATHNRSAEPQLVHDVGDDHNRSGQIGHKEVAHQLAGSFVAICNWPRTGPELSYKHKAVEDEADPGAENARLAAEG